MSFAQALAAFESEPAVRSLFDEVAAPRLAPGLPAPGFEASFPQWPIPTVRPTRWFANRPSSVVLPVLPGVAVPTAPPPCPALRGQPCRSYVTDSADRDPVGPHRRLYHDGVVLHPQPVGVDGEGVSGRCDRLDPADARDLAGIVADARRIGINVDVTA